MISLRIKLNSNESAGNNAGDGYQSISKNNLVIDYKLGTMFGFASDIDNSFICGETIIPQSDGLKDQNSRKFITPSYDFAATDNNFQTLLIINGQENRLRLYSNISSSRTCYYSFYKDSFICSSSITEMRRFIDKFELNEEVVPEYMAYRYVTPPKTLYKNIKKLICGQSLEIDLQKNAVLSDSLYNYSNVSPGSMPNESEISQKLLDMMGSHITDTGANSTTPGILLSGGLDSSLLGVLSHKTVKNIKSFSSSFEFVDKSDDENYYAQSVADNLSMDHTIYNGTKENYLKGLVESIYCNEEPIHHLQSVMLYKIFAESAASDCDIMFCGEGADMMFGNVLHSKTFKYRKLIALMNATGGNKILGQILKMLNSSDARWEYFAKIFGRNYSKNNHILYTIGLFGDTKFLLDNMNYNLNDIFASHIKLANNYSERSLFDLITIMSIFTEGFYSTAIWNKLAEKNNISIIYPFLTKDLIDYILTVPWTQKLKENKYYIRQMLRANSFPEEFVTRPKLSFGFPFKYWATKNSLFQPIVDMMQDSYDKKLLDKLQTEEPKIAMILWNLINLFIWHKLFIDNVSSEDLSGEIIDRHLVLSKKQ